MIEFSHLNFKSGIDEVFETFEVVFGCQYPNIAAWCRIFIIRIHKHYIPLLYWNSYFYICSIYFSYWTKRIPCSLSLLHTHKVTGKAVFFLYNNILYVSLKLNDPQPQSFTKNSTPTNIHIYIPTHTYTNTHLPHS